MAYTKNSPIWADSPSTASPLSAARLNQIENGLEAAALVADAASGGTQQVVQYSGATWIPTVGDVGKLIGLSHPTLITVTPPLFAATPLSDGLYWDLKQMGAGQILISDLAAGSEIPYINFDGTTAAIASIADAASVSPTGNFEIIYKMRLPDTTPASPLGIFSKWDTATANKSFLYWWSEPSGHQPYLEVTTDGSTTTGLGASGANSFSALDNTWYWWRLQYTTATRLWQTHYAAVNPAAPTTVPTSWTLFNQSTAGASLAIFDGNAPLVIGSTNSAGSNAGFGKNLIGDIADFRLRLSHGGADSFALSLEEYLSGSTYVTTSGHTVTLSGTASVLTESSGAEGVTLHTSGLTSKSRAQYSRVGLQVYDASADIWDVLGDLAAS